MAYLHINNLYKDQDVFLFKELYALEKIHGTSSHISWKDNQIRFFSGGIKHSEFIKIFDEDFLINKFTEMEIPNITIYGEAFGGKCQGMSNTYGKELRFIAFDVKIGDSWLSVPQAETICKDFNIEFIYYKKISSDLEEIDKERNAPSIQARRNGIEETKMREGIVLRPLIEVRKNNGERIIAKHKNDKFRETKKKRKVNKQPLEVLKNTQQIVDEWVTPMRLAHIVGKIPNPSIQDTGDVIKAMIEDVIREAENEIIDTKYTRKHIGKATAQMFKDYLKNNIGEEDK